MFSTARSAGDTILATDQQSLRKDAGLLSGDSISITYDTKGRIATIVHNDYAITYTITYSTIYTYQPASVTDGTYTWTFTYNTKGQLTTITKS